MGFRSKCDIRELSVLFGEDFLIDISVSTKIGPFSLTKTFTAKEIFSNNPRFLFQETFDSPQVKRDSILGIA